MCPPTVPILSQLDPFHTPPHPTSWRSILIMSSDLRLISQGVSFSQVSQPIPCIRLSSPPFALHAPPIYFFFFLNLVTRTILGEKYRSLSSSLCSFLHSLVISSLLGPNISLNTLFTNTLSLRSSFNVNDQVSHPYKTGLALNNRHVNFATSLQISIQWRDQNVWSVTPAFLIHRNATILRHGMDLRFILKPCAMRGVGLPPRCPWGLRSSLMLRGAGWVTDVSVNGPVLGKRLLDLWGWDPQAVQKHQ